MFERGSILTSPAFAVPTVAQNHRAFRNNRLPMETHRTMTGNLLNGWHARVALQGGMHTWHVRVAPNYALARHESQTSPESSQGSDRRFKSRRAHWMRQHLLTSVDTCTLQQTIACRITFSLQTAVLHPTCSRIAAFCEPDSLAPKVELS